MTRNVTSNQVIQALSKLPEIEKQKEKELRQRLRQRDLPDIDQFFASPKESRKSPGSEDLSLLLRVRPRKLVPMAASVQPSHCSSPANELEPRSVLQPIHSPKQRPRKEHHIYSDWEIYSSTQLKAYGRNFRSQAIHSMRNILLSHSPQFRPVKHCDMTVQGQGVARRR